jgi:hypothetical protein
MASAEFPQYTMSQMDWRPALALLLFLNNPPADLPVSHNHGKTHRTARSLPRLFQYGLDVLVKVLTLSAFARPVSCLLCSVVCSSQ